MSDDLDPCVREILCTLGGAVLGALGSLIAAQKAVVLAQLTTLKA